MKRRLLVLFTRFVLLLSAAGAVLFSLPQYDLVLGVKDPVNVLLQGVIPLKAVLLDQPVDVEVQEDLIAVARIAPFDVHLDETLDIPLNLQLKAPIESEVRIEEPLNLALVVPIDLVLTEKELDLSHLEIPIDSEVFIDDMIALDIVVPIDSEVETTLGVKVPVKANLPVKMQVPIRQKVRVKDRLTLNLDRFQLALRAEVPVQTQLQLKQTLRVSGMVDVPINQRIQVPLRQTIRPDIAPDIPLAITLKSKMPAKLKADLDAAIQINESFPAEIGDVRISAGGVKFESRLP